MHQAPHEFVDDHNRVVPYDGSELAWRISVQAVIEREGKILLIKDRRQEFYSTPGGGVEVDEPIAEALQREMLEEVGARVRMGEVLYVHQDRFYHRGNGRFFESMIFFFQAELLEEPGLPQDKNVEYARWFSYDELRADNLNACVYEVLKSMGRLS